MFHWYQYLLIWKQEWSAYENFVYRKYIPANA